VPETPNHGRSSRGTREWDAGTYDRVSEPQLEWGRAILARLDLDGNETVIDAGCGSGRVTELLVERLPRGRVIAVDGSAAMIERAGDRLGEAVELIHSDLLELDLDGVADAIFSSATFHWIGDHERLFERIRSWLRPRGRLEAQCGGEGNVARFFVHVERVAGREPFAAHLAGAGATPNFASPAETERRLVGAGFEAVECRLSERLTRPPEPRAYLESVCLGAHTAALPVELREPFVEAVAALWLDDPVLDYVRLDISARRPAGDG
jgi:trans-aconitate 2-methyltransferase